MFKTKPDVYSEQPAKVGHIHIKNGRYVAVNVGTICYGRYWFDFDREIMDKPPSKGDILPNGSAPHEPIKLKINRKALDVSISDATKENNMVIPSTPPSEIPSTATAKSDDGHFSIGKTKTKGKIKELMKMKDKKQGQVSPPSETDESKSGDSEKASDVQETVMDISSPKGNAPMMLSPVTPKTPISPNADEQYVLGDLLLGKVSGHPYWPCMIAYDPFLGIYNRIARKHTLEYHVEYFGNEGERGWITPARLIRFNGKTEFEAWCKVMKTKHKKDAKNYTVNASRRKAWEIGMAEAENAMKLSHLERKNLFTHRYVVPEPPAPPKPKAEATITSPPSKEKKEKLSLKRKKPDDQSKGATPPAKKRKKGEAAVTYTVCEAIPSATGEITKLKLVSTALQQSEKKSGKKKPEESNEKSDQVEKKSDQVEKKSDQAEKKAKKKEKKSEDASPAAASEGKSDSAAEEPTKPSKVKKSSSIEKDDTKSGETSQDSTKDETAEKAPKPKREKKGYGNSKWFPPKLPGDSGEIDYELEVLRLMSTSAFKKESMCLICELPSRNEGDLIQCEGPCVGTYHLSCLGLTVLPAGAFRCDECGSGRHTCFVCKTGGTTTRSCASHHCGRYYHEDCIQKFPLTKVENNNITCPLHTCATCAADNPKGPNISKGRMFRCVRCPTAYHVGDFCIAAGSIHLAGLHIVCSRHFKPVKTQAHHAHVNVSWCFICSKGGTLLCCESCPAAFHTDCLGIGQPNDKWYCADCARGQRPLYGDIVWVKVGNYRWWPGEICQPKHVPLNIQNKVHQAGEFPIRFFGSHDYFWTHQARVFHFQEGDKGSKDTTSNTSLARIFHKAVSEATSAFNIWCMAKKIKQEQEQEKNDRKPQHYRHVKSNVPIGSVAIYKADPADLPRCECRPDHKNPCGLDSECVNRLMFYECHPATCPAQEFCHNQKFTKREYPESKSHKAAGRGWGLVLMEDVKKGAFVNEYVGDLIDEEECRRRIKEAHKNNVTNFYMLTLDNKRIIDAGPKGNLSRFMNHSCQPNCDTQKWNVNGDVRVGLFANRDIKSGEELTFNYNLECLGNEKTACMCGAPNCSGFLGVRPKIMPGTEPDKKVQKKKRKRIKNVMKLHEDDCYRCGDGGDLVMCDKSNCSKVYHLKCLNLAKLPHGKWLCPWHHCDECGKRAVKLCSECPNSFCPNHLESNIFQIGDAQLVCSDHTELLDVLDMSRVTALQNDPGLALTEEPLTSSDTTSESSPSSQSDEDDSNGQTPTVLPKFPPSFNFAGELKPGQISRTSSSSSDSSEGRLCIVEDDVNMESPKPGSASPPKRKRSKSTPPRKRSQSKNISPSSPQNPISGATVFDNASLVENTAPEDKKLSLKKKKQKSGKKSQESPPEDEIVIPKLKINTKSTKVKKKSGKQKDEEIMFSDSSDNDFPELVMDISAL